MAASGSMVAGLRRTSLSFPPTGLIVTTKPGDPRQGQWWLQKGFFRENEARASDLVTATGCLQRMCTLMAVLEKASFSWGLADLATLPPSPHPASTSP